MRPFRIGRRPVIIKLVLKGREGGIEEEREEGRQGGREEGRKRGRKEGVREVGMGADTCGGGGGGGGVIGVDYTGGMGDVPTASLSLRLYTGGIGDIPTRVPHLFRLD